MNVKHVTDEVGNDRRARTALRKNVFMTRYLREYRRDVRVKHEVGVFDEKTPDATEIDGSEEIIEVDIEDISSFLMLNRVGDNRTVPLKAVR